MAPTNLPSQITSKQLRGPSWGSPDGSSCPTLIASHHEAEHSLTSGQWPKRLTCVPMCEAVLSSRTRCLLCLGPTPPRREEIASKQQPAYPPGRSERIARNELQTRNWPDSLDEACRITSCADPCPLPARTPVLPSSWRAQATKEQPDQPTTMCVGPLSSTSEMSSRTTRQVQTSGSAR